MAIREALLPEIAHETTNTRKFFERLPNDKLSWKPAEKSMTLSRLATHLAELPIWGENAVTLDELDIAPPGSEPPVWTELGSVPEILELFDTNVAKLKAAVESADDETLMKPWTLKVQGEDIFTLPKLAVIRSMVMNHALHHRGQLSVYLRLCDVPVPATYGPSADEKGM